MMVLVDRLFLVWIGCCLGRQPCTASNPLARSMLVGEGARMLAEEAGLLSQPHIGPGEPDKNITGAVAYGLCTWMLRTGLLGEWGGGILFAADSGHCMVQTHRWRASASASGCWTKPKGPCPRPRVQLQLGRCSQRDRQKAMEVFAAVKPTTVTAERRSKIPWGLYALTLMGDWRPVRCDIREGAAD